MKRTLYWAFSATGLLVLMASFQNCSEVQFRREQPTQLAAPVEQQQSETVSIEKLKPVFAVRAVGCLTCHATFSSKVITDMGYGDPFYLGGSNASGTHPINGNAYNWVSENGNIYGAHGTAFDETVLNEGLMVPRAAYPTGLIPGRSHNTLAEYMQSKLQTANPGLAVEEKNSIYIGAPSVNRILGLLSNPFAKAEYKNAESSRVDGFQYDSSSDMISNNNEIIDCDGDLVFDATVSLKNLRLRTVNGCRIYATRSVFIEGPITYVNQGPSSNLQITSAQSIIMGLGLNNCNAVRPHDGVAHEPDTLYHRILGIWTSPRHFTRADGGNPIAVAQDIYNQSRTVGALEALCQPAGDNIAFERILLNAPQIHSRYRGAFQGSVIAEFAVFSLSDFSFSFDPVFGSGVPILPLLEQTEYLSVSEF